MESVCHAIVGGGFGSEFVTSTDSLRAQVLNEAVIPVVALLMTQQQVMRGHRILRILLLQFLRESGGLAGRGLDEQHVVHVSG